MVFLDFEVFKHDWLVVLADANDKSERVIVNDPEALLDYYNRHSSRIWVGYNINGYDQYILKGILLGLNPKKINDFIIREHKAGWQFSRNFNKIPLIIYDVMTTTQSLKELEGHMGHDIRDSKIPFDLDRNLTESEIAETIEYCRNDVQETMTIFCHRIADFNAHMDLIRAFNLPIKNLSKSKAQLSAMALGCNKREHDDEWEIELVDTIKIEKYKDVVDFYKGSSYRENELNIDVCGIPHTFGLGGLHGAPSEPIHEVGSLWHVDVSSFYPRIMIEYDKLSRNVLDPTRFVDIFNKRLELKKGGKKKEQAPYKIILNATFGISNHKYSQAYDPKRSHEVCINGQLLLLDLIEKLEGNCQLIQSNTDGLIVKCDDFEKLKSICSEWERRTKMVLEYDKISEIWQGDVNNYVYKLADGSYERKGAYVKELSVLDYDLPIVNKAIFLALTQNELPEDTILECDDLLEFQKIVKLSNGYKLAYHNGEQLTDRDFRVYASRDFSDSYIGKQKTDGGTIEKFANTPEHCKIVNEDVRLLSCPRWLDKMWYVELANKRLKEKFNWEFQ